MNTNTGAVYEMGGAVADHLYFVQQLGGEVSFAEAERRKREKLTPDERDAIMAVRDGDPVVPVSGRVAQQMKVGQRELKRRERRRVRDARKRNRG